MVTAVLSYGPLVYSHAAQLAIDSPGPRLKCGIGRDSEVWRSNRNIYGTTLLYGQEGRLQASQVHLLGLILVTQYKSVVKLEPYY